jgi:hypothetical protein
MKLALPLRCLLLCWLAISKMAQADPIDVGQVVGFTPGIHGAVELVFQSEVGKYYQIQISADMATWDNEGYSVKGTGGQVSVLARTRNLPSAYYRLRDDGSADNVAPVGPEGPAGSDATVTTENVLTAVEAMSATQQTAARAALDTAEAQEMHARLWKWRQVFGTNGTGVIGLFGDSLLDTTETTWRTQIATTFGSTGAAFLEPHASGGATWHTQVNGTADYTYWMTGAFARLSSSGHTATINVDNVNAVEANTLKLYYVVKSGGGTFKVQTRRNGGAWTDVEDSPGVPTLYSTNGSTSAGIITYSKTDIRTMWELRAQWVSGGAVDIIGGALYDTRLKGARLASLAMGSTLLSQQLSASTAVSHAILADVGVNLALLSYLDSPADVLAYQDAFQDYVDAGTGSAPTWIVIGTPVGYNEVQDASNAEHSANMKAVADLRRDAFFDNRRWAGTPAQAVASGLIQINNPHYLGLAIVNWIPRMISELGIADTTTTTGRSQSIKFPGSAEIRRDDLVPAGTQDLAILGNLSVGSAAGTVGGGFYRAYDSNGPVSNNDWGGFRYTDNVLNIFTGAVARYSMTPGFGRGAVFYESSATVASPKGMLGTTSAPMHSVTTGAVLLGYTAKTADYAIGLADYTINVTANSPTITLPTAVGATGQVYVIANTGAGTVTMATTSSQTIDGGAPGAVVAGARLRVQSTGANWITW